MKAIAYMTAFYLGVYWLIPKVFARHIVKVTENDSERNGEYHHE